MDILNNRDKLLGDNLKREIAKGSRIRIAASCFSIYAFNELRKELESIEELSFIFSSPAFSSGEVTDKFKKEKREFFLPNEISENSLYGTEFEVRLRNKLSQKAIARECAEWIKAKVKFKSNKTGGDVQSYIAVDDKTVYTPINGFTTTTLGFEQDNTLLSPIIKMDDAGMTRSFIKQFDEIWRDPAKLEDVTDNIVEQIASAYNENAPEYIYFIALYNIFTEFLSDLTADYLPQEATGFKDSVIWNKLYNFQRDGAIGIINKLEKFNGCILADSVGLGKTFTALAVMQYYSLKNRSILVLCPKRLADNWKSYCGNTKTNIFYTDKIRYDVFYHTDLGRRGMSNGVNLAAINWGNYDLVVIDESHNFRNINPLRERESRYDFLMNHIMKDGVKTKVLMLSATPVNNRYNDLRNQLALAYCGDYKAFNDALGTEKSVQEIFRQAQRIFNDWSKLPSDKRKNVDLINKLDLDFRTLLDSVTIARSRKNITKYYNVKDIGNFPKRRKPISCTCALTGRQDVFTYKQIYEAIYSLTLSVYAPFGKVFESKRAKYIKDFDLGGNTISTESMEAGRETGIKKLMNVNLLKRLESSCEAFRLTIKTLIETNKETLKRIEDFQRTGGGQIERTVYEYAILNPDEDEESFELSKLDQGKKVQIDLRDIDCVSWHREISHDVAVLNGLLTEMGKVTVEHDSKLRKLKELITDKIQNPINAGNKKVLIFSAFADTTTYLYTQIAPWVKSRFGLESAKVEGGEGDNKSTLQCERKTDAILTLFSPISKDKANSYVVTKEDKTLGKDIDVLIATDCISEGQNLQDCDICINYDIHWNPVRIVQRFGRIDRIGSRNAEIQLVNFWCDIKLDEYIKLNSRVESRMAIVDQTTGAADNLLTEEQVEYEHRALQIKKLQEGELQDLEDVDGNITITDLGLNEFRMDIVNYIKTYGEPKRAPKGMHTVVAEDKERGIDKGVIFVLRNTSEAVKRAAENRLKSYYLVYITDSGEIKVNHLEVKHALDIMRSACKDKAEPMAAACRAFNSETKDGYKMDKYSRLLEKAIASIINVKAEKDIDSLFTAGGTTALTGDIKGLDDFELICFVVVK
ncbi:helicase [Clostridia bacterium]|nr:helicase [Clostridia bacterium]